MAGVGCALLILTSRRSRVGRFVSLSVVDAHVVPRHSSHSLRPHRVMFTHCYSVASHCHSVRRHHVPLSNGLPSSTVITSLRFAHLSPSVPPPLHIRPLSLLAQAVDSFLPPSRFTPSSDAVLAFRARALARLHFPRTTIGLRVSWPR